MEAIITTIITSSVLSVIINGGINFFLISKQRKSELKKELFIDKKKALQDLWKALNSNFLETDIALGSDDLFGKIMNLSLYVSKNNFKKLWEYYYFINNKDYNESSSEEKSEKKMNIKELIQKELQKI